MITKDINEVSPLVCETEKITIELVDKMAERLYKNKSKLFLQKYYNKSYNIINQYKKIYESESRDEGLKNVLQERLVLDYISGMMDEYVKTTYRRLKNSDLEEKMR